MAASNHLVFVYGTLKRGQPNHEKLTNLENGKATFVGEARTVEKWPLVVATKFNIPFLLDKQGLGHVSDIRWYYYQFFSQMSLLVTMHQYAVVRSGYH